MVFVGEPLNGSVIVLSRFTGKQIGELPPPPNGFSLPFIMHAIGQDRVAVLDAGGLPQPNPFVPVSPFIYEYTYSFSPDKAFSATLVRTISFAGVPFGFPEDFVRLDDGRYLISDSILGSIWVVQSDGTITPGIVPKSFDSQDLIPTLAFCPTMPEITVNGYPFLFSGSTLPGVSPLAVRNGTVYYYSPCARGIYSLPLAILSDDQPPYQRAAYIKLVAPTPADDEVEELLDFSFNPFNDSDSALYAADPLQLQVIRIDLKTGARQVIAHGPELFDFPSSLAFLPTHGPFTELLVVSNRQDGRLHQRRRYTDYIQPTLYCCKGARWTLSMLLGTARKVATSAFAITSLAAMVAERRQHIRLSAAAKTWHRNSHNRRSEAPHLAIILRSCMRGAPSLNRFSAAQVTLYP